MSSLFRNLIPVLLVVTPLEASFIYKAQNTDDEQCINKDITIIRLDSPDITPRDRIPEQARLMFNGFRTHLHG